MPDNATVLLVGCVVAFVLALVDAIQRGRAGQPDLSAYAVMVLALTVLWVGR